MQEHPIPQDITGYRFHIIGSMTLKQFGEILLGVVIAGVVYSTNLTAVVKWPLILFSVGIGAAAAFVPIEERPLDHWISTFFKVMYRPTKFFWKKDAIIPEAFLFKSLKPIITQEPELDLKPAKQRRIKEYLGSVPEQNSFSTDFSTDELDKMQKILSSFNSEKTTISQNSPIIKSTKTKPNLDVRVRRMRTPQDLEEFSTLSTTQEKISFDLQPISETPIKTLKIKNSKKAVLASDQVAQEIQIPEKTTIKLETKTIEQAERAIDSLSVDRSKKTFIENKAPKTTDSKTTKNVTFNSGLPFPIKPNKPNKLVGMVLSKNNDLLSGSIIEVQSMEGRIERAVKTNALGQFFITTPLKVGEYNVVVEKDNYIFQPLHIKINDEIIEPLEIRSEN